MVHILGVALGMATIVVVRLFFVAFVCLFLYFLFLFSLFSHGFFFVLSSLPPLLSFSSAHKALHCSRSTHHHETFYMVNPLTTTGRGVRLISWNTKGMNKTTKVGIIPNHRQGIR